MEKKTCHALYATAAAALLFGLTPATKILADEITPTDEIKAEQTTQETSEQATQETTTDETTPVVNEEDPNVSATPVQTEDEQKTYSLTLDNSMPGVTVPKMTNYTSGKETPLPVLKKDGMKFNGWIYFIDGDMHRTNSIPANVKGDLACYAAWKADYRITNDKDQKWTKGSNTPLTIKINSVHENFYTLSINGKVLNTDDYKYSYINVNNGNMDGYDFYDNYYNDGTIIQIQPSYLESLPVGQPFNLHIVYGYPKEVSTGPLMVDCEVDGTLTVTPAQSVDNTKTTPSTSSNTALSTTANMTSPNAKMSATNTFSTTTTTQTSTDVSSVDTGVADHSGSLIGAALISALGALGLPILKKRNQ